MFSWFLIIHLVSYYANIRLLNSCELLICEFAALKPHCRIGNLSNFPSSIRALIRVSARSFYALSTRENLGAHVTDVGVFFVFFLTLIAGYAWRAIYHLKI